MDLLLEELKGIVDINIYVLIVVASIVIPLLFKYCIKLNEIKNCLTYDQYDIPFMTRWELIIKKIVDFICFLFINFMIISALGSMGRMNQISINSCMEMILTITFLLASLFWVVLYITAWICEMKEQKNKEKEHQKNYKVKWGNFCRKTNTICTWYIIELITVGILLFKINWESYLLLCLIFGFYITFQLTILLSFLRRYNKKYYYFVKNEKKYYIYHAVSKNELACGLTKEKEYEIRYFNIQKVKNKCTIYMEKEDPGQSE